MLRTLAINSNQIVLSFGVLIAFSYTKAIQEWGRAVYSSWKSFWKLKFMKNQDLELHSPLPKSFKVCKERTTERGKTEWRKQRTATAFFFHTFGALPEVHFLHSIYHFKAPEVKNLMLQTVHDSELKWRSYSHWKLITPRWRKILHGCEITLLLRNDFAAILHSAVEFPLKFLDICNTLEAEHHKLKANFAALRNNPFAAKWFRCPFCVSAKSRRPRFHLRIGP